MSANKLRQEIDAHMRDNYGALSVRINSGVSRGYVASNYWQAPRDCIDALLDAEVIEPHKCDAYLISKQTAGFPDTEYLLPNGITIRIELKTANDRLSEAQEVFIALARSLGHTVLAIGSIDELERELQAAGVDAISGGYRW